jgi:hypothetical protein
MWKLFSAGDRQLAFLDRDATDAACGNGLISFDPTDGRIYVVASRARSKAWAARTRRMASMIALTMRVPRF